MQKILDKLAQQMKARTVFLQPAQYIPECAAIDPDPFAISVYHADGSDLAQVTIPFHFRSSPFQKSSLYQLYWGALGISFGKALGMNQQGLPSIQSSYWNKKNGRPRNPFITVGAIVTTEETLRVKKPKKALGELSINKVLAAS